MGRNPSNNVIVKEASKEANVNVIGNAFAGALDRLQKKRIKPKRTGSSQARIRRARETADQLVRKFGPRAKSSYQYFCKCAYNLPQATIWNIYESSQQAHIGNSLAYFLAATKAQPQMS